ncbi:DUF4956 domain-containing protein [Candidatus Woesearchaeota archaeon]|jgi:uncharacterized membrane protein YhiD involved in acid resistance|nr:DUF4956 domain-containing protein [Candidatus Woesearchaeota archaeon]
MNKLETFEQYFATSTGSINIPSMILALFLAALLSYILGKLYIKYGSCLSNRAKFAGNFMILTTTTTLIISVVKSSLALSLGLVGALSIIRFRAAIKEPEELAFLFLTIAIGLGFGANQFLITIIAFVIISFLIILRHWSKKKSVENNMNLTINSKKSDKVTLKNISFVLNRYCTSVNLKRFESSNEIIEASFFVTFDSFNDLERVKKDLEDLSKTININYLERE